MIPHLDLRILVISERHLVSYMGIALSVFNANEGVWVIRITGLWDVDVLLHDEDTLIPIPDVKVELPHLISVERDDVCVAPRSPAMWVSFVILRAWWYPTS